MSLFSFVLTAIGPWAIRALVAVGFASVSFAGVTTAFGGLVSYAQGQWGGLPAAVLQLATLFAVPQAIGLVFGAMSARIALWAAGNATKLVFKG
jgi:hypothetical protein